MDLKIEDNQHGQFRTQEPSGADNNGIVNMERPRACFLDRVVQGCSSCVSGALLVSSDTDINGELFDLSYSRHRTNV